MLDPVHPEQAQSVNMDDILKLACFELLNIAVQQLQNEFSKEATRLRANAIAYENSRTGVLSIKFQIGTA